MPAKKKICKEDIIHASLEILRSDGYEKLNVRKIATYLKCSTQPIYFIFKNMDELKSELFIEAYNKYIEISATYQSTYNRYKAHGMGYIRFAHREKQLFRYLFMGENTKDSLNFEAKNNALIHQHLMDVYHFSSEMAKNFHTDMAIYTLGLAVSVNLGAQVTDEEISQCLERQFRGMLKVFKVEIQ